MKYAIIRLQGQQFKVSENDKIKVNNVAEESLQKLEPEILFYTDGEKVEIGNPILNDVKVELKLVKNFSDKKISIRKFKAKVGYRRKRGFRPQKTLLKVEKISVSGMSS